MSSADYDTFEKLFCGTKWQNYKDENMVALLDHSDASPVARAMTLEMTTSVTMSRKGNSIVVATELLAKTGETHKYDMTLKFNEDFTWKDNEENPTTAYKIKCWFADNKFQEITTPVPPTTGKPTEDVFAIENNEMVMFSNVAGDKSVIAKRYFKKV